MMVSSYLLTPVSNFVIFALVMKDFTQFMMHQLCTPASLSTISMILYEAFTACLGPQIVFQHYSSTSACTEPSDTG